MRTKESCVNFTPDHKEKLSTSAGRRGESNGWVPPARVGTRERGGTDGNGETGIERKIPCHGYGCSCREDRRRHGERSELPAVLYRWQGVSLRRGRMGEAHRADW